MCKTDLAHDNEAIPFLTIFNARGVNRKMLAKLTVALIT